MGQPALRGSSILAACLMPCNGRHCVPYVWLWPILRSTMFPVLVLAPGRLLPTPHALAVLQGVMLPWGMADKGEPCRLTLQQKSAGLHSSRADAILPITLRAEACLAQSCRCSSRWQRVPPLLHTQAGAAVTLLALVSSGQVIKGRS